LAGGRGRREPGKGAKAALGSSARPTRACRRRQTASARASLPLSAAPDAQRSTENKTMPEDYISLRKLGEMLGINSSQTRKYILKLGYNPPQARTPDSRGKLTYVFTREEAESIIKTRSEQGFITAETRGVPLVTQDFGMFYLIQIIPEFNPNRLKFGFAADVQQRLAEHRTSAPTASILKTWPCKRSWESTITDCLASYGCELILNEVYECKDLQKLLEMANQLFSIFSNPHYQVPLSMMSPLRNSTSNEKPSNQANAADAKGRAAD
jgi:hypothetical protein